MGEYELSLDANETRSLFRRAYRDSDERFYDLAVRSSYFMADVAVDHSRDIIHYHNDFPDWHTYSLIYQRFSGIVLGYMETGDYYLLETAEAVAQTLVSSICRTGRARYWPQHQPPKRFPALVGVYRKRCISGVRTRVRARRVACGRRERRLALRLGDRTYDGLQCIKRRCVERRPFPKRLHRVCYARPEYPPAVAESRRTSSSADLLTLSNDNGGFHPATSGFLGRIHWYLACRLQDPELIETTHEL